MKAIFIRGLCALLGLLSVAALLAWVFGLGSFAVWFWGLSFPATVALIAIALWIQNGNHPHIAALIAAAGIAGVVGTVGYDLFRIPFVVSGLRLFAPVDSYGVLILDASSSSPWTGLAGWSYHFINGIGFAVAYVMVMAGRRWWWGVLWGLILETATVLTPFASYYELKGQWGLIAIAYAAHIPYGAALGIIGERAGDWDSPKASPVRARWVLLSVVVFLLAWHRPFITPDEVQEGIEAAPGPSAIISEGRFVPEWLRVAPGECGVVLNRDDITYRLAGSDEAIVPGSTGRVCPKASGVHRVRLNPSKPYSGGFVIVDPARKNPQ